VDSNNHLSENKEKPEGD